MNGSRRPGSQSARLLKAAQEKQRTPSGHGAGYAGSYRQAAHDQNGYHGSSIPSARPIRGPSPGPAAARSRSDAAAKSPLNLGCADGPDIEPDQDRLGKRTAGLDPYVYPDEGGPDQDVQAHLEGSKGGTALLNRLSQARHPGSGINGRPGGGLGRVGNGTLANSAAFRRLGSFNTTQTFQRRTGTGVGSGAGGGGGGQRQITDYMGAGGSGGGAVPSLQVRLPAGMVNHGNTCYLNAVLQVLLSIPGFVSDLCSERLAQISLPGDGVVAALRGCLEDQRNSAAAGADTAAGSSTTIARRPPPISPGRVRAAMARRSARWGGTRQEDAHEFLTELLDVVQREVLAAQDLAAAAEQQPAAARSGSRRPERQGRRRLRRNTRVDGHQQEQREQEMRDAVDEQDGVKMDAQLQDPPQQQQQQLDEGCQGRAVRQEGNQQQQQKQDPDQGHAQPRTCRRRTISVRLSRAACPASRAFTGCLQHELRCQECGHVTTLKEQFSCLSLDLPAFGASAFGVAATPLESLLAGFFAGEELEKSCDSCHAESARHTVRHTLRRLPPVLIVHLKRFSVQVIEGVGAVCRKLSARVVPDVTLDLSQVVLRGRRVPPPLAELLQARGGMPAAGGLGGGKAGGAPPVLEADKENVGFGQRAMGDWEADQQQQPDQQQQQADRAPLEEQQQQVQRTKARKPRIAAMQTDVHHAPPEAHVPEPPPPSPSRLDVQHFFGAEDHADGGVAREGSGALHLGSPLLGGASQQPGRLGGAVGGGVDGLKVLGMAAGSLQAAEGRKGIDVIAGSGGEDDDEMARALAASLQTYQEEQQRKQQEGDGEDAGRGCAQQQQQQALGVGGAQKAGAAASTPQGAGIGSGSGGGASGTGSAALSLGMRFSGQGHTPLNAPVAAAAAGAVTPFGQERQKQAHGQYAGEVATTEAVPAAPGMLGLAGDSLHPASPPGTPPPRNTSATGSPVAGAGRSRVNRAPTPIDLVGEDDEDEQLKKALEASRREYAEQEAARAAAVNGVALSSGGAGGGSGAGITLGITNSGSALPSVSGVEGVGAVTPGTAAPPASAAEVFAAVDDEEAALYRALALSAAEYLQQQQRQQQEGGGAEGQQQQQQGEGAASGGDDADVVLLDTEGASPIISGNGAGGEDEAAAGGAAGGTAGTPPGQPKVPLMLIQLLEDSDDEPASDEGSEETEGSGGSSSGRRGTRAASSSSMSGGESEGAQGGGAEQSSGCKRRAPGGDENVRSGAAAGVQGAGSKQLQQGDEEGERQNLSSCKRRATSLEPAAAAAAADESRQAPMDVDPAAECTVGQQQRQGASPLPLQQLPALQEQPSRAAAAGAAASAAAQHNRKAGSTAAADSFCGARGGAVPLQENAALYRLHAVVRHKGPLASSGHFVADVQSQEDPTLWIHYDDSYVSSSSRAAIMAECQGDGYLFFYIISRTLGTGPGARSAAAPVLRQR